MPIARRILALVAGLVIARPALSQTASVTVFGPMRASAMSDAGGVRRTAASDFALYEFGTPFQYASQADPRSGFAAQLPPGSITVATGCPVGLVPPRALNPRTLRARRLYWPIIAQAECRWRIPSGLMDSLVIAESGYDPAIISHAGAAGLAQLMPGTAADLGVVNRFDPVANVDGGAHYLRTLLDGFGGNVPLALAAYNAGAAAVRRGGRIPANQETPGYVDHVLSLWSAPGIGPMSARLSARQTAQMLGFYPSSTN